MGYFSNGTEGMMYEEDVCSKCVHYYPTPEEDCTVLMIHALYNYDECNNKDSILHDLIPRSKDGLYNEKCKMFFPQAGSVLSPPPRIDAQYNLFLENHSD